MFSNQKSEILLANIREGRPMSRKEKLNLIIELSIPSILAQITTVMMFFIDASMVGHLGTNASASIGLVESSTWLLGSMTSAAWSHLYAYLEFGYRLDWRFDLSAFTILAGWYTRHCP